jgi:hypothetical protein
MCKKAQFAAECKNILGSQRPAISLDFREGTDMLARSAFVSLIVLAIASVATACLRATPDKRAIQWSDTIVRGKVVSATAEAGGDEYEFEVVEGLEGALKTGKTFHAIHSTPAGKPDACAGAMSPDDKGKVFLLLLRSGKGDVYTIVTAAPVDASDPTAAEAFKQLLDETRRGESSLTDEQVLSEATTLAAAEDDTEAEHAEGTLLDMGPKAASEIKRVMATTSKEGKQRLQKVLDDILPPVTDAKDGPTSKPVGGK